MVLLIHAFHVEVKAAAHVCIESDVIPSSAEKKLAISCLLVSTGHAAPAKLGLVYAGLFSISADGLNSVTNCSGFEFKRDV